MKLSEKILLIFSSIFFFCALAVLITSFQEDFYLFWVFLALGLMLGYGYVSKISLIPTSGIVVCSCGGLSSNEEIIFLGISIVIFGLFLGIIEKKELKQDIREVYKAKYKKDPEKVDVVFFSLSFNLKERKKRFNTYFTPHIKNTKIQTNGKIQKFFYDDEYKMLYERE